jgi:hypothetical protein
MNIHMRQRYIITAWPKKRAMKACMGVVAKLCGLLISALGTDEWTLHAPVSFHFGTHLTGD